MLARFYIDRLVLAWVISIIIVLLGAIAVAPRRPFWGARLEIRAPDRGFLRARPRFPTNQQQRSKT